MRTRLSVTANARKLGQSFQGHSAIRRLTLQDHLVLSAIAAELPLEPRARILPEERLEAAVLTRNRQLAAELQELYDGRCQVTGWAPRDTYGHNLCHAHHVHWLSRGGDDTLENLILVSPNLHVAIHRCDAPFDFEQGAFIFDGHTETLRFNAHLPLRMST